MNQKGFATLEVILMVVVIGILATIAVPRFTDIKSKASVAKIQADMTAIDNALSIYYMENGKYPDETAISALSAYINDADKLKPPTGNVPLKSGEILTIVSSDNYTIGTASGTSTDKRALLKGHTVGDF